MAVCRSPICDYWPIGPTGYWSGSNLPVRRLTTEAGTNRLEHYGPSMSTPPGPQCRRRHL